MDTREKIRDELFGKADERFLGTTLDDIWSEEMTEEALGFLPGDVDEKDFPQLVAGVLEVFLVYLATRVYDTHWILGRLQEWTADH